VIAGVTHAGSQTAWVTERTSGGWTAQQAAVAPSGYEIWNVVPCVFGDGSIAVAYTQHHWTGSEWLGEIRLASCDNGVWSSRSLMTGAPYGLSGAVAGDGRLWLAYEVPAGGHWSYKRVNVGVWDGQTFSVQDVDASLSYGSTPALALDASGRPHVAYDSWTGNTSNCYLKHAVRRDDGSWASDIVVNPVEQSYYDLGLAVDAHNVPHLCYGNDTGGGLWHAWEDGGPQRELVSGGRDGSSSAIAVDDKGGIGIAFRDYSGTSLRYARNDGNGWELESIPAARQAEVGGIWYDAHGMAQIAFEEESGTTGLETGLKLATQVPEPATLSMLALGGLAVIRKRKK